MLELKIDKVTKQYKNKIAVDRVDAVFTKGVHGILGANGAGKTTLLRMIVGILKPTAGEILCNGAKIQKMGGSYRRLLGYLPQDFGYYPEFTAERYLYYLAELKAVPKSTVEEQIEELLLRTGLEAQRKRKVKTFSGGMRRRLGIAQALLGDPEILILDEPTSGLDPKERIRFRNLISSLGRDRIVLLSSHIVSDLSFIAEKIILMKEGHFLMHETPEEVLKTIVGRVWECTVTPREAEELNLRYAVSNMKNSEGRVIVRIVSEKKPAEDARKVEPELEDVYLYYFGEEETGYETVSGRAL